MARFTRPFVAFVALLAGLVVPVLSAPPAHAATSKASIGDASVLEGDSGTGHVMTFTVSLDQPAALDTRIDWAVMTGTGAGIASSSDVKFIGAYKTLLIRAGKTYGYVNVPVYGDLTPEGDETFDLHLLGTDNPDVTLDDHMGEGTVIDDDGVSGLVLAAGPVSIHEGNTTPNRVAKVWVTLSDPAPTTISVPISLMGASATPNTDYKPVAKTLTFLAGQYKKAVAVTVIADTGYEGGDEQFHVMLPTTVSGATVLDSEVVNTIQDEDVAANLTTTTYSMGPYTLSPNGQTGWEREEITNSVPRPAGVVGIQNMRFALVDGAGNPVSHHTVHLHHNLLLDWGRTDVACGAGPARFAGAGKELQALALPDGYAYKTTSGSVWSSTWHLMNMSSTTQTVYMKYTIDYLTNPTDIAAAHDVTTYWNDVMQCVGSSEFNVPGTGGPGSYYTKTVTVTHAKAGIQVYQGGHLHDGGVDIVTKRKSNGQTVCTNTAGYDAMNMLDSVSACSTPVSIAAGEQFSYTARYKNDSPWTGAMGLGVSYVAE